MRRRQRFRSISWDGVERVVGIDINPAYVEAVRSRFRSRIPGLELYVADIQCALPELAPVDLLFAALIFEYVDVVAVMLTRTGIRYKVIIISACYSGVFIPPIADADTLVVTAADANHSSFGCEDKAKWTYFGDAFFNTALRQTSNLKEAFLLARSLVSKRELRQGFEPSHSQMAGGGNVEPLLVARR